MKKYKGIFYREEIEDLLKEMKTYVMDGEIERGKYYLYISITPDSAGEEGYIYFWELGILNKSKTDVEAWIDGDGYFYSDDELIDNLYELGIIK
jgi:hypothetical protein